VSRSIYFIFTISLDDCVDEDSDFTIIMMWEEEKREAVGMENGRGQKKSSRSHFQNAIRNEARELSRSQGK
jgi:hypothetical protein